MTIIEDDGTKELYENEIEIDIDLKENNTILFVPFNAKNNRLHFLHLNLTYFEYKNLNFFEKNKIGIILSVIGAILIIIIIIIVICCCKKCKKNKNDEYNSSDNQYTTIN